MKYITAYRLQEFDLDLWSERDRCQLTLRKGEEEIFTFRDGEVNQLIEDGFLHPNNLLETAIWYADHLGLL